MAIPGPSALLKDQRGYRRPSINHWQTRKLHQCLLVPETGIESAALLKELFRADGESGQVVRKVVGEDEKREEEKKSD